MYAVLETGGRVRLLGELPNQGVAKWFSFEFSDWPAAPDDSADGDYALEPDFEEKRFRWVRRAPEHTPEPTLLDKLAQAYREGVNEA